MRVGVALEDVPKLLQDLVLEILGQQRDIAVVKIDETGRERLMTAITTQDLDALIVSKGGKAALDEPSDLLRSHPRLKLLELSADGRSARCYDARGRRGLDDVSPEDLVRMLRDTDG